MQLKKQKKLGQSLKINFWFQSGGGKHIAIAGQAITKFCNCSVFYLAFLSSSLNVGSRHE